MQNASLAEQDKNIILTENGKSNYSIVVSSQAAQTEKKAASELQHFIKKISGVELPVITDDHPIQIYEIILGNNRHLKETDAKIDFSKLVKDGFTIQTAGPKLIIAGKSPRGTLFGVYTFLEKYLGCRWFTAKVSRIPSKKKIVLGNIDDTQVPVLFFRETGYPDTTDPDFAARLKLTGPEEFSNLSMTHLYDTGKPGDSKHNGWGIWCHTFWHLVPPYKYFKKHPEYYSFIDGKRRLKYNGRPTQLCLSNPEVFQVVVNELKRRMAENPNDMFWDISQNDSEGNCQCVKCKAIDEREGTPMGSILTFVNKVAAEFPDKIISTLAYSYSRKPPKTLRPASNVLIILCFHTDKRDCLPLEKSNRTDHADFREDIEKWSEICNNLFIWDYLVCYPHTLIPNPNLKILQPNFKFYLEHNCKGIYAAMNSDRGSDEFNGLRNYLLAKLMWDVNINVDETIDEFLSGMYGKAAIPIRRYIDLLHDSCEQKGLPLSIYGRPSEYKDSYLSPELIQKYNALFDEAEQLVAYDPEKLHRVQKARLPVMYAQLQLDYGDVDEKLSTAKKFFEIVERDNIVIIGRRRTTPWYKDLVMDRLQKQKQRLTHKLAETSGKGNEFELSFAKPVKVCEITTEIMEENSQANNIHRYTIEGFDGKNWLLLGKGTTVGYKSVQPAIDVADILEDSSWKTIILPLPKKKAVPFWNPFTKGEKQREYNSLDGLYSRKIEIPADWAGQNLKLEMGKQISYSDDDVDSIVYFNGWKLSHGWSDNPAGGNYDTDLLQFPNAIGRWAQTRYYYVPSWAVHAGRENQITVCISATIGPAGLYEGPLMLSTIGDDKKETDLAGEWRAKIPGTLNSGIMIDKIRLKFSHAKSAPTIQRFAAYKSINRQRII